MILHMAGSFAIGIIGGTLLWMVAMVAVTIEIATQTTGMTSDQQFFIEIVKAVAPGIGVIVIGLVPTWYARKSNQNSEAVKADLAESRAEVATLGKSIDGQLDEFKRLWQSEANLKGRQEERDEAESRKVEEAASARTIAKEDRQEGREAMEKAQEVIPVETRTEAAKKDE